MPKRIQRKRIKGWKMPPNTVSVTRPGKWGNPFKISGEDGHWFVIYKDEPFATYDKKDEAITEAINQYRFMIKTQDMEAEIKRDLRGKDLACFCKEGDSCHADILLEIANS